MLINKLSLLFKMLLVAIVSLCYVLTTGCYTKKHAMRKFCNSDSVSVVLKDTIKGTVTAPSVAITYTLNCDSFQRLYDSLLQAKSPALDTSGFVKIFEDSNASVLAKKNANGSTTFKTKTKPKEIPFSKPIERIITVPCNCPDVCPKTIMERLHDARFFILTAFVVGFALALYIKLR